MKGGLLAAFLLMASAAHAGFFGPTATGNITVTGVLITTNVPVGTGTAALGMYISSAIPATGSYHILISSGLNITLTATPTVSTSLANGNNVKDGTWMVLTSTDTRIISLQDNKTLSGSLLNLNAPTIAISSHQVLGLMFNSGIGRWVQMFYSNN